MTEMMEAIRGAVAAMPTWAYLVCCVLLAWTIVAWLARQAR